MERQPRPQDHPHRRNSLRPRHPRRRHRTLGPIAALLWISLSIGGLSAAAPIGWSIPSLITPRNSVGSVGGIINFSNQISGIAAPIVTGYLVQSLHSFAWAFGVAADLSRSSASAAYIFLLGRSSPCEFRPHAPEPLPRRDTASSSLVAIIRHIEASVAVPTSSNP